jgi:hypothetical protein
MPRMERGNQEVLEWGNHVIGGRGDIWPSSEGGGGAS